MAESLWRQSALQEFAARAAIAARVIVATIVLWRLSWVALIIGAVAALPQGAEFGAYTAAAIGGASFIEGYLITPYLQNKILSSPPAVLIFSMSAMGLLFGAYGVILAAPITIVLAAALASTRAAA